MIDWYSAFLAATIALGLLATKQDRAAARIVCLATLASMLLVDNLTRQIVGAWKLAIPGTMETLTILCLLRWARNRTGYAQVVCLSVAWIAHLLCYVDCVTGSDLIYTHYESVLGFVSIAQFAFFHDTIGHNLRKLADWVRYLGASHVNFLRPSGVRYGILRNPHPPKV